MKKNLQKFKSSFNKSTFLGFFVLNAFHLLVGVGILNTGSSSFAEIFTESSTDFELYQDAAHKPYGYKPKVTNLPKHHAPYMECKISADPDCLSSKEQSLIFAQNMLMPYETEASCHKLNNTRYDSYVCYVLSWQMVAIEQANKKRVYSRDYKQALKIKTRIENNTLYVETVGRGFWAKSIQKFTF